MSKRACASGSHSVCTTYQEMASGDAEAVHAVASLQEGAAAGATIPMRVYWILFIRTGLSQTGHLLLPREALQLLQILASQREHS